MVVFAIFFCEKSHLVAEAEDVFWRKKCQNIALYSYCYTCIIFQANVVRRGRSCTGSGLAYGKFVHEVLVVSVHP